MRRIHGFTIVELLIVVVVIGILAAISIVAYNGVSQKANNAAIIDAAGKTQRLMQAYIAIEGKYPLPGPTTMFACVTTETGCRSSTEDFPVNATFDANMAWLVNCQEAFRLSVTVATVFISHIGAPPWRVHSICGITCRE